MSDDSDQISRLRQWLETSGYALEMRVARTYWQLGADFVDQARLYSDPESSKARECDVVALHLSTAKTGEDIRLYCVTECKSGRKKPWVGFISDMPITIRYSLIDNAVWYGQRGSMERFSDGWEREWVHASNLWSYSVVAAHGRDEQENDANPAARAVKQVLSATFGLRNEWGSKPQDGNITCIWLPVVITTAPLFTASVTPAGTTEVAQTDRLFLYAQSESDAKFVGVHIMNEDYHRTTFVPQIRDALKWLCGRRR